MIQHYVFSFCVIVKSLLQLVALSDIAGNDGGRRNSFSWLLGEYHQLNAGIISHFHSSQNSEYVSGKFQGLKCLNLGAPITVLVPGVVCCEFLALISPTWNWHNIKNDKWTSKAQRKMEYAFLFPFPYLSSSFIGHKEMQIVKKKWSLYLNLYFPFPTFVQVLMLNITMLSLLMLLFVH
jgi:hypothetical protein